MHTKEELVNLLRDHVILITFLKTDGTLRKIRCTLQNETVKQYFTESKSGRTRPQSESNISVIDLENGGWRSFKVNSVQNVELVT